MKRSAAIVVTLLSTVAVGASAAEAEALPPKTSFTVVTSFVTQPSQIVEADGPWADCTGVVDLSNYANQVAPRTVRFSGEKQVLCASGDVGWFIRRFRCDVAPVCDADADKLMEAARETPIPAQRYALLSQAA